MCVCATYGQHFHDAEQREDVAALGALFDEMFFAFLFVVIAISQSERQLIVRGLVLTRTTHLVGDEDVHAARLDHIDRVVRLAYLEQVVVRVHGLRLHVLAHLQYYLLVEVAEHSSHRHNAYMNRIFQIRSNVI